MTPVSSETPMLKARMRQSGVVEIASGESPRGRKPSRASIDPNGQRKPGHASARQSKALYQQLRNDARPAAAQREPHGDLFLPRRGARDQQIRHVRAGDQQHQSDDRRQHQQRASRICRAARNRPWMRAADPSTLSGIVALVSGAARANSFCCTSISSIWWKMAEAPPWPAPWSRRASSARRRSPSGRGDFQAVAKFGLRIHLRLHHDGNADLRRRSRDRCRRIRPG